MKRFRFGFLLLLFVVIAVHGSSLWHGLILDDYEQRAQLREGRWTWPSLVDAARLGAHDQRVEMWWQEDADLRFFRPIAFGFMRLQYVFVDWRPWGMHLFSLLWTLLDGTLVLLLARHFLGCNGWAVLVAILFVMHPANAMTIRWIACQNQLMVTAFVLAGLLLYARFSRWRQPTLTNTMNDEDPPVGWTVLVAMCGVVALGCREDGVILGALIFLGDLLIHPSHCRKYWPVYVAFVAITLQTLLIRREALDGLQLPGPPYAMDWHAPGFARFVFDKMLYYLLGLFACVPIVGFAGARALQSEPVLFYGASVCLLALIAVVVYWQRHEPVARLAILLLILPMLPVATVFASSHHLYMPSLGAVLLLVLAMRGLYQHRLRGLRWAACVVLFLHGGVYAAMAVPYHYAAQGFHAACELPVREVARLGRPVHTGDRLFFINLPMMAFNAPPAIRELTGAADIRTYALTFSTGLLRMAQPCALEVAGPNQLKLRMAPPGYFSRLIGEQLLSAAGRTQPFAVGERFTTGDFRVEITRSDQAGVQEMVFTFERPLDDPGYHFYMGSPVFAAYPLDFSPPANGSLPDPPAEPPPLQK